MYQINKIIDNLNPANTQDFTFDAKSQLKQAIGNYGQIDYSYDSVGNRTEKITNLTKIETHTIDPNSNRLLNIELNGENRTFTFDDLGNVVDDNGFDNVSKVLTYGDNKRLISVDNALYGYNPYGQRVLDNGKFNHFDLSGNLIAVNDSSLTVEYIYLGNMKIAMIQDDTVSENIYYFHNNYMALPRLFTDNLGNIVWSGEFKPYGELYNENGQVSNLIRFIGKYENVETEYFYNYFRDYDPSIGRYLQSDPIGLNGGINTYTYVANNPINYLDSLGLSLEYANYVNDSSKKYIGRAFSIIRNVSPYINNLVEYIESRNTSLIIADLNKGSYVRQYKNIKTGEKSLFLNMDYEQIHNLTKEYNYYFLQVLVHETMHIFDYMINYAKNEKINNKNSEYELYPNNYEYRADLLMNEFIDNAKKCGLNTPFVKRFNY